LITWPLGPEHLRQCQAYLFQSKKLSPATVSQCVSALPFLLVKTLRPVVLSPEEVTRLIDAARELYHRTLLMTLLFSPLPCDPVKFAVSRLVTSTVSA
jgi:hypothetical protein